MASSEVTLLETNAHRQDLLVRHLAPLLPLSLPVREMALVESMRSRHFTFSLYSGNLVTNGACNSLEYETPCQNGYKRMEQHDGIPFSVPVSEKRG